MSGSVKMCAIREGDEERTLAIRRTGCYNPAGRPAWDVGRNRLRLWLGQGLRDRARLKTVEIVRRMMKP